MRLPLELRGEALAHVEALAAEHGIELRFDTAVGPIADRPGRIVWGPYPFSPLTYMVILHEIGHIVRPDTGQTLGRNEIVAEAVAWQWAAHKAIPKIAARLSARDLVDLGSMFTSYVRHWALKE